MKAQCHKRTKKAEAAKEEGPSTETAVNKDVGSRSEASPHDCIEETHKKRTTFIVLQKNTRSLNSSERLEEMHSELHDIRWDATLISETWRQSKEIWETQQSHIMVESGKFTNKHGVAILLNRRWKNCINWIQYACERVVAMSISIYKHPVVLMSVFLPHSGFADHHVERTYKTIIDTIKKEKCAKIIGGDFNAELGPGEGVELSAVVHHTLNKVNGRGEWMTQWLLENKLVALNTMHQKIPQKQVTYRSPKNDEKQLDYVLLDKNTNLGAGTPNRPTFYTWGATTDVSWQSWRLPQKKRKENHENRRRQW